MPGSVTIHEVTLGLQSGVFFSCVLLGTGSDVLYCFIELYDSGLGGEVKVQCWSWARLVATRLIRKANSYKTKAELLI